MRLQQQAKANEAQAPHLQFHHVYLKSTQSAAQEHHNQRKHVFSSTAHDGRRLAHMCGCIKASGGIYCPIE